MKTKIRLQFGNDKQKAEVADFSTYLYKSQLFSQIHLDENHGDLVEIVLSGVDLKSQFTWLISGLTKWLGWEFVGPECPHFARNGVLHNAQSRNMISSRLPKFGREKWMCFDMKCRKKVGQVVEQDRIDDVMNYREFSMTSHLVMTDPAPVTRIPAKIGIDTETQDVGNPYSLKGAANMFMGRDVASQKHWREQYGKIDYSKPNMPGQIPRYPPDANKISRTLLNTDFQSVEFATLFYQLGVKDPQLLHFDRSKGCKDAASWIDDGGVILLNADTNPAAMQNIFTEWALQNSPADGVQLAIFEVDDQNLSQEILEEVKLKEAAKTFSTLSDNRMRVARQQAKNFKFSDVPLSGKVLNDTEAKKLMDDILNMFPNAGSIYTDQALRMANEQIAMLNVKVAKLEDEVKDCDDVKEFMHKEMKELREKAQNTKQLEKELSEWDGAQLLPKSVAPAMDRMLRFLAGLNMQDHTVADQREFNECFKQLKDSYKEVKDEQMENEGTIDA